MCPKVVFFFFLSNFQPAEAFEGVLVRNPFKMIVPRATPGWGGGGRQAGGRPGGRRGQRQEGRGGEGAGPEPGEAGPPSDSSAQGSRASTAGATQRAPRPPPGPGHPKAALSGPCSLRGTRGEEDPGRRLEEQQPLPPQPPWPVRLPARARRRTSWKAPAGLT